jgi:putative peptidoglycan lipid II flippase
VEGWLASRIARQLVAGLAMMATLWAIKTGLQPWFAGSVAKRMAGVMAIVGGGMAVYFPLVWVLGGIDKEELMLLRRRKKPAVVANDAG